MLSRMALRRTLGLVSEAVSCHSFHTTPSIAAAGKSPLGQLRKQTGYSLSLCKKALAETQQDVDKAKGSSLSLLYIGTHLTLSNRVLKMQMNLWQHGLKRELKQRAGTRPTSWKGATPPKDSSVFRRQSVELRQLWSNSTGG